MIWDKPIHANRSISDWLSDKDTGIPYNLVSLVMASPAHEMKKTFIESVVAKSVVLVSEANKDAFVQIARMLKTAAPYVDVAMWVEVTKLAETLRNTPYIAWTETSLRKAYCSADILVVSDIPPPDAMDKAIAHDRREIEHIISERFKLRNPALTIVVGPNHQTLSPVRKYSYIVEALNDAAKT